jgi:hypothetical protein
MDKENAVNVLFVHKDEYIIIFRKMDGIRVK